MSNDNIVIFSPHPDDETIACGGLIAKKISEESKISVAIITDGRNCLSHLFGIFDNPTPLEIKEIRRKEAIEATKILGVSKENLHFLDFIDGELYAHKEECKEIVKDILLKKNPDSVYVPHKNDIHGDHLITYQILLELDKELDLEFDLFQYVTYEKYPRINSIFRRFRGKYEGNIFSVDVSRYKEIKEKALSKYVSQYTVISPDQTKPVIEDIYSRVTDREVFYKV